jgi:hypothetical protein
MRPTAIKIGGGAHHGSPSQPFASVESPPESLPMFAAFGWCHSCAMEVCPTPLGTVVDLSAHPGRAGRATLHRNINSPASPPLSRSVLHETLCARQERTTSRGVANSSPRQTHERRVLREGASFAFCAWISRGGPGWPVTRCLGVLTTGSPGSPRWPTEWAESLSGSLAGQGAGLRQGRSRWSGHYPRGRPRWFGPDPLRTVTRG